MSEVHEIDYRIFGSETQFVEVELDPGESVIAEAGAMMAMEEAIEMETIFGDGKKKGLMGKLFTAGKRWIVGESLFLTVFTNKGGRGKQRVYFAAPYPGTILPMDLKQLGGEMICQKQSFLCAAKGIAISVAFQQKLKTGIFGGEGFIMQKLAGEGLVFIHAGGSLWERTLEQGEMLRIDTGCLVAMMPQVDYSVEFVGSVKSALFGGEGLFFATLRGPGRVWLQSLPFSRMAGRVLAAGVATDKDEGSILGGVMKILD